jgi:photosynthetic reaction center H subunit
MRGGITDYIDVAQLTLYAFWFFFAGLVWYLRGEDRREGYPLESEGAPQFNDQKGWLYIPPPKTYFLRDGATIKYPSFTKDPRPFNADKIEPWPGAPFRPKGDPLLAAMGPGSWVTRPEETYKTLTGEDLVVPLRVATHFRLSPEGGDPIGLPVIGGDKSVAGTIKDVWVDRSESIVRYYEVALADGQGAMLVPVYFADVQFGRQRVVVKALLKNQFALAPRTASPDRITLQEEDKVAAFLGGGTLYSTPERAEPLT